MPWIRLGRYHFDLADVILVTEGISQTDEDCGVTISLTSGKEVEMAGEEARHFLELFAEFTASRPFGLPPPPGELEMREAIRSPTIRPGDGVAVEERRVLGGDVSWRDDQAEVAEGGASS